MYGGYRDVRKAEDNQNMCVPSSAKTSTNRLRGLRSLSGLTQPVRTKHLLEELRGVYDESDNSASKPPANAPQDDPLISWDKHSLPKGLEWMKPTPSKSKLSSANTIPATVGNFHARNNSQVSSDLVLNDGAPMLSTVSSTDKPKAVLDLMNPDSHSGEPPPPILLNDFEKENVFMPVKQRSESQLPDPYGLLSSTRKVLPVERKSEVEPHFEDSDINRKAVQREDLFTPLKRMKVADSTPATSRHVSVHPSHKIVSIPENTPSTSKFLPDSLHPVQSGRKSPLSMQPHLSLLTPVTHSRTSSSALATDTKTALSSLGVPLENQPVSKPHDLNVWMTPAKGVSPAGLLYQEYSSGMRTGQILQAVHLEEKSKQQGSNSLDILNVKSKGSEEIIQLGDKQQVSKITLFPKTVQPNPVSSCLYTPKPLVNPVPVSSTKSLPKNTAEMPPPDICKLPVKSSPESAPHIMNPSSGTSVTNKKSTHEQIFVNGKAYTVLSLLGRGGSSVVYQVLEPGTSNVLAIKCVNLSELDQSTYDGYLNEIKLLAQLQDSDCVIRMFDHQHCVEEKLLYVVMEKGDTDLSKLIRDVSRTKKISPAMIVYYWTEMLNAVNFIHKRGTIHSDLKPANFLLVAGRLKLIDFGIASAVQADMTSVMKDCMTGTYNYISPEALCSTGTGPDGRSVKFKISYKSDVWSLGCILYNLVYGHTPFQTITHQFTKMKAIADPKHKIPFPPAPGCPRAIVQAMQACLVRDPKLRPTVEDLLHYPYFGSVEPAITDKA